MAACIISRIEVKVKARGSNTPDRAKALEGITVIALEQAVAAPMATSRLADAGARVIKLERAEGDFARGYDGYVQGQSSYFIWINRGKESCVVDLRRDDDLAFVKAMIARADVFVQNLAPGATGRLGLDSRDLRRRHPSLIACDIGGFAEGTPDERRKAYDLLIQAETGLAGLTGSEASGPSRVAISIGDIATGQAAYAAILEALVARGQTGVGRHIQLSLFDTVAELMNVPYLAHAYGGVEPKRMGLAHPSIVPYRVFRLSDGEILIAIQNEREWAVFCERVLGNPEIAVDGRFCSNTQRVANRLVLEELIATALASRHMETLCALLDRFGIAYGRVSTIAELKDHRSLATTSVMTPAGPIEMIAPAVVVDGERARPGTVAELDQHGKSLRAEFGVTGPAADGRIDLKGNLQ
jgi:crotonobetainyl-CoA:carnitine CoA-transferase CaiB-like acyl-CoA transferase